MSSNDSHRRLGDEYAREARAEEQLWRVLGTLYRWRRFILGVTATVAVTAVVLTLLMPNQYRATARVLLPESSGGGLASLMLKNVPSAASALLGGGGGDYIRYLAILNSRTVLESAVDSFDLVHVYELEESDTPRQDAIEMLSEYAAFEMDEEYEFLSVSVLDTDPQRAAELSNFLVRQLNAINARLSALNATSYRRFIENRYHMARADMDRLLDSTRTFQRRYGVYDLPAQTQSFFEHVAGLRTSALQAEIQHDVLAQQYGPDNPNAIAAGQLARSAQAKYQEALRGQERLFPVSQETVPDVARRYAELEMERVILTATLEVVGPLYENARMQEEQRMEAVQVLDDAVPPSRKAAPKRSIICVLATLSALLLASVFALLFSWWDRNHHRFARRLREAADEQQPTTA